MLEQLKNVFKPNQVRQDQESLYTYGKDWTTYFDPKPLAIVMPETTEQVQSLVLLARQNKTCLVPSGGRTGLSGAAVATKGEVIVSFDRMNRILDWNPMNRLVQCESGVVIETIQNFAKDKKLYYPVDFAARGSAQVGGSIATNAGGIKVVRYGMTRRWVQGLKVVTGTGDILNLNKGLVKNATGYDLRNLFIGSEGTLGFITEASLELTNYPQNLKTLLLAPKSLEQVMDIFTLFRDESELCAFEMFSHKALEYVINSTELSYPFTQNTPQYYVVLEVECAHSDSEEKLLNLLETCFEKEWVTDGLMAQSEEQAKNFWRYRENISESISKYSPYKNDISVTIANVTPLLSELDQILHTKYPDWKVVWFGHIGDGNLHINILRPEGMSKENFVKECQKVDESIFTTIAKYHGSISAEHGVGLTKKPFLQFSRTATEIEIMRGIKKVFDPDNIINPGKVF
jgi:glycolate oxidase subunit GlcD